MFSWAELVHLWNTFFFEPEPVATLCICRVLLGLLVIVDGCLHWNWRKVLLSPNGVLSSAGFTKVYGRSRFTLFNLLPDSQKSVDGVLILYIFSGMLIALGAGTPYCFFTAWLLIVSLHHRGMYFMTGGDALLRIVIFLFCFSQAGVGLSVDAWLAGRGFFESMRTPVSPWCTRLLQIQVSLLYFRAFASKMQGPTWRNGTAVLYAISNKNYCPRMPPKWMRHRLPIALATYTTLGVEFALATLIWVREFRGPLVVAGLLLHLGMELTLNLQLFGWLMCLVIFLFVDPYFVLNCSEWLIGNS